MKSISKFELLPQRRDDITLPPNVVFDGKLMDCELAGSYLDAQFQCSLGFLLISNEDSPYEEGLHITLLSPNLDVIDALEITHAYAPGSIRNLQIVGENSLEFTFFGGDNWRLTILASPQRWSLNQLTPGVGHRWKRLLKKGYLNLRRLDLISLDNQSKVRKRSI